MEASVAAESHPLASPLARFVLLYCYALLRSNVFFCRLMMIIVVVTLTVLVLIESIHSSFHTVASCCFRADVAGVGKTGEKRSKCGEQKTKP